MKKYLVFALSLTLLSPAPSFSAPKKPAAKTVAKKPVAKKPVSKKVAALPSAKPSSIPASTTTKGWIDEGDSCDPAVTKTVKGFPKGLFMEDWLKCDEQTRTYVVGTTPTANPISTPTLKDLTFSNITQNVDAISFNVFSKYQSHMASNFQSSIKVNTLIGPNTVPVNKNSASAYLIGSKIFQNFKQPDEVFAIFYTYADKEWAKNQVAIKAGKEIADFQFGYSCPNASRCEQASASVTLDWKAINHFGASDPGGAINGAELNGEIQIHEFTHSVSFFQLNPIKGNYYNLTPDWYAEGHASFTGKLGASTSFAEYIAIRNEAIRRNGPGPDIKDYQPENILRFYESFSKYPVASTIERFYLYTLGWSTIEALAAIGGIDSPMNLFVETANGLTFKQAFKKTYGIEWDTAAPILAEVVSKQYMQYYP